MHRGWNLLATSSVPDDRRADVRAEAIPTGFAGRLFSEGKGSESPMRKGEDFFAGKPECAKGNEVWCRVEGERAMRRLSNPEFGVWDQHSQRDAQNDGAFLCLEEVCRPQQRNHRYSCIVFGWILASAIKAILLNNGEALKDEDAPPGIV